MSIKTYKKGSKEKLTANFKVSEFACKGAGCCAETLHDPALSAYLQQIREHFGKPLYITSGYRCATHNKAVGGASGSRHTKGQAADFYIKGVAPAEIAKYAESIGVLGIGLYEDKDGNFVHIDTRTTKFFWYGHAQAYRSTFGGAKKTECGVTLPVLKKGCEGDSVKALQTLLIGYKYSCGGSGVDGDFGAATHDAVCRFQKNNGLTVTGVVDAETWNKLLGV